MRPYIRICTLLFLALLGMTVTRAAETGDTTVLWTGYAPAGESFNKTIDIDFSTQKLRAVIDLSTCQSTTTNENVLSFGSNIGVWAGSGQHVHIYYTKRNGTLNVNLLSNGGRALNTYISGVSGVVTIEFSRFGLTVDGISYGNVNIFDELQRLATLEVGSCEGRNRSWATYDEVIVCAADSVVIPDTPTPETGKTYVVSPAADRTRALTVTAGNLNEVVRVSALTDSVTDGQRWILSESRSVGFPFLLVSEPSGLALDVAANGRNQAPLLWTSEQDECKDNPNQELKLIYRADSTYYINARNNGTDYYLRWNAAVGNLATTTDTTQATAFTFTALPPVPSTEFRIGWIRNPQKVSDNMEDAHATFIPYVSTDDMRADSAYAEPWLTPHKADRLLLNGEWKFRYVPGTTSGPGASEFQAADYDDSSWGTIRVPRSWETAGFGKPVYTNQGYPFRNNPPNANVGITEAGVTDHNATGFYRRTFTVPESWRDKRVVLHFDGLYSAAVVWVNGRYVGYTQSANTDSEFDLTDYVCEGDNQLSVRVYRWCDGSYIEGQDMWHLSGIHRDVYLYATPKVFVGDHYVSSKLSDDATSGTMSVALTMQNRSGAQAERDVVVRLLDAEGNEVGTAQTVSYDGTGAARLTATFDALSGLHPWTAETPYLYTIEVSQRNDGAEEMAFSTKYGFRNITRQGTLVYINGKRVFFKGVNTQDTHPEYGRAIDVATMLQDVTLMKRANVNTVRTSHYPRQPKMYAMFDAYGLYVMDEADMECHGNQNLASSPNWTYAIIDREVRMVMRDRNHPSVIFWSMGNESGSASDLWTAIETVRGLDDRMIHYEGNNAMADISSSMYPGVRTVESRQDGYEGKPYFICEYEHSMGQSLGALKEYWDIIESSTGIIGGCIWDWVDQAIYNPTALAEGIKTKNGFHYWVSGYDYNNPNYVGLGFQGNFLNNGVITPDRAWTSKLAELKKVYSNIAFTDFSADRDGNGTLTIRNKNSFVDLSAYRLTYIVTRDGRQAAEGVVALPAIAAGAERTVSVPCATENDGAEYLIHFYLRLKEPALWAPQDYPVVEEQYELRGRKSLGRYSAEGGTIGISGSTVSGTTADGTPFAIVFDGDGKMTSWTFDGHDLIAKGPDFNSYRDIDNDRRGITSIGMTDTSNTSVTSRLRKGSDRAIMTVTGSATNCNYTIKYTFYTDATVDMDVTFNPTGPTRRIGLGMQLSEGFEDVEYYGRGPWSNYVDRKSGSYLGRYRTTVDRMVEEQIHPQTYGDHQDLRELVLTDTGKNLRLQVKTSGDVAFSLSHYDETDYCGQEDTMWRDGIHWYDLTRHGQVFTHFDAYQWGLGNNSCSGDQALPQYQCKTSVSYSYTLRLTPYAK